MATTWTRRWKYEMSETPEAKGVWRLKDGGFYIRARPTDPRTGKFKEISRPLFNARSAREALVVLHQEVEKVRSGVSEIQIKKMPFREFAASLLERKVSNNEIRSASGRKKWGVILEHHLLPVFGDFFMDKLTRSEIVAWHKQINDKVQAGEYSPNTANDWLAVLRVIVKTYVIDNELDRNPTDNIKNFKKTGFRTYTDEEPNSLLPSEVPVFLAKMKQLFPQHYAMTALGFTTGLRPSTLRPLRRQGDRVDARLTDGVLLVRRSHTLKAEVMEETKIDLDQRIALPTVLVDILQQHVDSLPQGPMLDSDLLFPSDTGGFRARSVLDVPFDTVAKEMSLTKNITPKAMRRTYQDLARAAQVKDIVTRAVSGHTTEAMQRHYSTVSDAEIRESLGGIALLAGLT